MVPTTSATTTTTIAISISEKPEFGFMIIALK
jgi:hypothetical protein